jgi:hypothetical protein
MDIGDVTQSIIAAGIAAKAYRWFIERYARRLLQQARGWAGEVESLAPLVSFRPRGLRQRLGARHLVATQRAEWEGEDLLIAVDRVPLALRPVPDQR